MSSLKQIFFPQIGFHENINLKIKSFELQNLISRLIWMHTVESGVPILERGTQSTQSLLHIYLVDITCKNVWTIYLIFTVKEMHGTTELKKWNSKVSLKISGPLKSYWLELHISKKWMNNIYRWWISNITLCQFQCKQFLSLWIYNLQ
jgi:hypothetical protein